MMMRQSYLFIIAAGLISVGLYAQVDFSHEKVHVSRQVVGAFGLAFFADVLVAILSTIFIKVRRLRSGSLIFGVSVACDIALLLGISFWFDLFRW